MPQARKSSSSRSRRFKEPAALKRLNRSLDAAQQALADLGKSGGRDVGLGARDLQKDLRAFVTNARGHGKKLAKALQSDFEAAQKQLAASRTPARATKRSTARKASSSSTAKRSTAKRTTAKRSTAKRSTRKRS